MAEHPEKGETVVETGGIMKIDCYISQGCGSEEVLLSGKRQQEACFSKIFSND